MILYCDTSALVKLYAEEAHSQRMRDAVLQSSATIVSLIAWVEMHAAFGRKERTQAITKDQTKAGLARLDKEWDSFTRLGIDAALVASAGKLAVRYGLRAYDSVQLASAQLAYQQLKANMVFCCFDKPLNAAAASLEIPLLAP